MSTLQVGIILTGCFLIIGGLFIPVRSTLNWKPEGLEWATGESKQYISWEQIHEYERRAK